MRSPEICVVGAGGLVGRRICSELAAAGVPFSITTRTARPPALAEARAHVAEIRDAAALASAFAGARVVINAAGPLRETAAPVLVGALTAGAHYVDVGGEQEVLQSLYERHESTARRAGLVALPGAGLDCMIGDLAAAWATAHLCGGELEGAAVRSAPAPRLAEDRPLDEVCVSYVFDDLVLSAGSQRALFGAVGGRAVVWRRDRWEPGRAGERRRVNAGAALGGERDAVGHPAGDAVTVPRHVSANLVATYLSTTRTAASGALLRLLATALPLVPRAASQLLAAYATPDADYAGTRLAVIAQARRGFSAAQVTVRGLDPYRVTAVATAWAARQLLSRGAGPVGMRAPGELFRGAPALRELAAAADLTIEPSFGPAH
ncbi:MAG: Saccharopine dehydrogenase [Deltaproteobacteria bacterium]|nr:Saccharopine dehydrogenase [Deltaproteobacteria bacterium]